jgi:hypothetical protein
MIKHVILYSRICADVDPSVSTDSLIEMVHKKFKEALKGTLAYVDTVDLTDEYTEEDLPWTNTKKP